MADDPRIEGAGEGALIVYLGATPSPALTSRVQSLGAALRHRLGDALEDLIPSYASLLILFDPFATDHGALSHCVRDCLGALDDSAPKPGRLVEIPVYYAPESGADIEALGERSGLGWEGVAELHAAGEYRVCAIGFAPGFAYLGEVDERIAAPRLATPRMRVPRGAVAIADRQTAVYPAESPGGWNLIGRSPLRMFDAGSPEPMPVAVGDRVRFVAIDRAAFEASGGRL
jgi:KipI family sensor histidine kinase inhibitor